MNQQNVEPNSVERKKKYYRISEQVWIKPLKISGKVLNVNTGTKEITVLTTSVNTEGVKVDQEKTYKLWEVTKLRKKLPMIRVKYLTSDLEKIEQKEGSDWIDLRAAEDIHLGAGNFKLIPLGIAMQLPHGYEAHVAPRSSTFKNWGIIQTNSVGVVDNSYQGEDDQWFYPVYATRDTVIKKNDRICQFRIIPVMGEVFIKEVEKLHGVNRGGFGSSGVE